MAFKNIEDISFSDRMLWASVLRRAVFDYVLYKGSARKALDWKRAYQYIFVEELDYDEGLSFEEVCALFSWEPDYLRRMTSKLTRADIKKMETTQFREEFVYDTVSLVVEQTERWKTSNFAVPFLPITKYSEETRQKLKPRVVHKESLLGPTVPMVQWVFAIAP